MLAVSNLGYRRNQKVIFRNITFKLEPGTWVEISGPNGSGKTTVLKILAGLILPSRGRVVFEAGKNHLHYLPQTPSLYEGLTVEENLKYYELLYGNQPSNPAVEEQKNINIKSTQLSATLSSGEKQKLSIAKLKTKPAKLWLLDEPLNALDKDSIAEFQNLFDAHLAQGGMAVLASHMPFVSRYPKTTDIFLNLTSGIYSEYDN